MSELQRDREKPRPCANVHELLSVLAAGVCQQVLASMATNGEVDVTSLAKGLGKDVPTVSRSLARLQRHALVHVRQEGKCRIYRASERVAAMCVDSRLRLTVVAQDGDRVVVDLAITPQ